MDLLNPQCAAASVGPANQLLTSFITSILALHCNITASNKWPKDYGPKALRDGLPEYDYVVIGAGSAGSVVAGRLAENPHNKILLIEAGDDPPLESEIPGFIWPYLQSDVDWSYETEPDGMTCRGRKDEACIWNKGKLLGGTHCINAMNHLRGNSRDFDEWKDDGNPTWGWVDVLPFFKKTEQFRGYDAYDDHGTRGPLSLEPFRIPRTDRSIIFEAADDLGYNRVDDFVGGHDIGFGRIYGTLKNGRRMTTAGAFLTKNRPNLHVIKNAVAKRIFFNHKLKAEGVKFVYKDQYDMVVHAKKEIILSAGAVETPKLLMLSGIGPATHLKSLKIPVLKDLPVGNNLQDHVAVQIFIKLNYKGIVDFKTELLDAFYNQWVHSTGLYASGSLDVAGFLDIDGDGLFPEVELLFTVITNITLYSSSFKSSIVRSLEKQVGPDDRVLAVLLIGLRPESRGYIRLQSKDYRYKPLIFPNFLSKSKDLSNILKGIRKLEDFEESNTFKDRNAQILHPKLPECDRYEYRSLKYWECYVKFMSGPDYHACGTAKMGPRSDPEAVVNSELKVIGVKGLRVIDASIMPKIVSANINAATIMIGEKGADFIKRYW